MASDFRTWAARQQAPFTVFLVFSLVGSALLGWLTQGRASMALALVDPVSRPWGLVTYPWAYSPLGSSFGLIFLAFFAIWLLRYGSSVERDMSTPRFAAFWAAATLLPALVAASLRLGLAEPWLPTSAVVVAWCARNRNAPICFWGITVSAALLAAFLSASVLFAYGAGSPLFGLLMALPLALAWAFGADRTPLRYSGAVARRKRESVVRGATKYDESYFENVKDREIEREERERLRKLFEGEGRGKG